MQNEGRVHQMFLLPRQAQDFLRRQKKLVQEEVEEGRSPTKTFRATAAEGPQEGLKIGVGGHCVFKKGFMRTFLRNQDVTMKLKSELIFIKFQYFFNVPSQSISHKLFLQCVNHKKKLSLRHPLPTFGSFSFPLTQGQ